MPRARRGGYRQGTPGVAYPQRTDLNEDRQPVRVASGQPYGQRQAQEAAQRAVPLPAAPPVAFDRPTEYPTEPLTAGLPVGPGPGPEALALPFGLTEDERLVAQLRGLYARFPNRDLARLLDRAMRRSA